MASSRTKSILKMPTVGLFEEVEEPRKGSRAEHLFDQIIGPEMVPKMPTYANRHRKPLTAVNNKTILADLRPIDSSLSDIESNDSKDNDFEPSAKTSRTRIKKAVDKRKNKVKFAESPTKRASKKPQSKKDRDYPNATATAVLEAYQKANLPDFDQIAKLPLHTSKYTDRADPPTPPLHQIMAAFDDMLPKGWDPLQTFSDAPNSSPDTAKNKNSSEEWETQQSIHNIPDENLPIDNIECLGDNPHSESVKSSSNKCRTKTTSGLDFRHDDSLRTAGVGASRIASTPVQRRHNVTLKNVSPITTTSPDIHSPINESFVKPQPPKNKKSIRKVPKASVPKENLQLDIVEPSLSDLDKVTLGFNNRSQRLTRTLIESPEKSYILTESPKSVISEESHTIVKQPNSTLSAHSSNSLRSHSSRIRGQRTRSQLKTGPNDLSSIFDPKVKSTPLVSSAKYQLLIDRSHLDISMAKMCRSINTSRFQDIPKTTTIVPVVENSYKPKSNSGRNTKRFSNVYQVYRKSLASVHSALNKTCQPSRTVIRTSTLTNDQSSEDQNDVTVCNVFDNQTELKKCFEHSLSNTMFLESKVVRKDNDIEKTVVLTPKKKVLLYCEPNEVIDFENCFEKHVLNKCRKIGEGSYGEVFASKDKDERDIVIKIIPLIGNDNQSEDDLFVPILPELVISLNFNHLKTGIGGNKAPNFIDMIKATTTRGKFPTKLISEWDRFDKERQSENEDPRIYTEEQLYIIFHLANGGQDLEHYNFESAVESLSVFAQLALALAAAERALEFEHRDLHWGNVLIANTSEQCLNYTIDGIDYNLNPKGVFASIIDFSLSRMTDKDFIIFDDLTKYSDLFEGSGDYQFDIYRMMRSLNGDNWQQFLPKSNIFWLHYILDKVIAAKKYKKYRTNDHKQTLPLLKAIKDWVLEFDSAADLIRSHQFSQYLSKLN